MSRLHETRIGTSLIDRIYHAIPQIIKQLTRIADAFELRNQVDALIRAKKEELEDKSLWDGHCKGCGEKDPICYCDAIHDNKKDKL